MTLRPSRRAPAARSLTLGGLTLLSAVVVLLAFPQQQAIPSVWSLLAHLVPFVLGVETVASLRPEWFERWRLRELVQVGCFLVIFGYFVPRLFDQRLRGTFDHFYYLMLTMVPVLILALGLSHRIAGGRAGTVRRACYACLLLMLSGIEDVMFWVWRGQPVPPVWDWAYHINVFLGHVASRTEAYVFIAVHVVLAGLVLFLPDRYWRAPVAWVTRGRVPTRPATGAPEKVPI